MPYCWDSPGLLPTQGLLERHCALGHVAVLTGQLLAWGWWGPGSATQDLPHPEGWGRPTCWLSSETTVPMLV